MQLKQSHPLLLSLTGPTGTGDKPYSVGDIYNADEFALFFAAPPSRNLFKRSDSSDRRKGSKILKSRVTGLAVSNASGSHKLKMLIIGKSAQPRAFKTQFRGPNLAKLPVTYRNQAKGWMNTAIWNEFLQKLDSEMRTAKRHILLLCDNFAGHAVLSKLTNIKVCILCHFFINLFVSFILQPIVSFHYIRCCFWSQTRHPSLSLWIRGSFVL